MLLSRREVNMWPAFADLMFVFALTTLVVAGGLAIHAQAQIKKSQAQIKKSNDEIKRYRDDLERAGIGPNAHCGLATKVVDTMSACLQEEPAVNFTPHDCSLSIDGAILFNFKKTTLSDDPEARRRARHIARCVVRGASKIVEDDGSHPDGIGLDAISIEGHADACGYTNLEGLGPQHFGAERANAVYNLVFDEVRSSTSSEKDRLAVLARVSTRSFGSFRPLRGSRCDCSRSHAEQACADDRRVEIVVQGRLGTGQPNWGPLTYVQWRPQPEDWDEANGLR